MLDFWKAESWACRTSVGVVVCDGNWVWGDDMDAGVDGLFLFEFEDAKSAAPNPTTNTGNGDRKRSRRRKRAKIKSCTILWNCSFL